MSLCVIEKFTSRICKILASYIKIPIKRNFYPADFKLLNFILGVSFEWKRRIISIGFETEWLILDFWKIIPKLWLQSCGRQIRQVKTNIKKPTRTLSKFQISLKNQEKYRTFLCIPRTNFETENNCFSQSRSNKIGLLQRRVQNWRLRICEFCTKGVE